LQSTRLKRNAESAKSSAHVSQSTRIQRNTEPDLQGARKKSNARFAKLSSPVSAKKKKEQTLRNSAKSSTTTTRHETEGISDFQPGNSVLIESIPAPEPELVGLGFTRLCFKRHGGNHIDRYWFTPKTEKRLRSRTEVVRFLRCLEKAKGDEDKAYDFLLKNSK
jgi:hypothetical protein